MDEIQILRKKLEREKKAREILENMVETRSRELYQTNKNIEKERILLRTLIDSIPDYIYIKDREHRFIVNNKAHMNLFGLESQDEVVGKTDLDFFPKDLAGKFHAVERKIMETGKGFINEEGYNIDEAGNKRWFLSTKLPVYNNSVEIIGLVGVHRNITEQKELEKEKSKKDKLEAINNMIVTINHEMNQPLSIITSYSNYIMKDAKEDSQIYKDVKLINDEAWKLAKLVN